MPSPPMRGLDRGESFTKTSLVIEAFRGAPPIDYERFCADVDAQVDQDPAPRA